MGKALKIGIFSITFAIILGGFLIIAGSCGQTVGFGTEIDFEPPVLTLDPGPNPRYVRNGAALSGTVTDNVKVEKVELHYVDSITGEPGSLQATISGNTWTAVFNFDDSHNGRKLITTITAYDKAGNSGESAIKTINLYVDLHEPDFSGVEIARSNIKTAGLESLADLESLEISDPGANTEAYVNRYQNGDFWIRAQVSEGETTVDEVYLNIYDAYEDEEGKEVISHKAIDSDSTVFTPRWTITEEDLLDAPGRNYRARAGNGERLYFRVSLEAVDRSENTGHSERHIADYDYFCYLPEADNSRSALGSGITQYVSKGTIIPVSLYDDDIMVKAWVTLISAGQDEGGSPKGQWNDPEYIGAGTNAPGEEKLDSLMKKLEKGETPLYDWHYDKYGSDAARDTANPTWRDDWKIKPSITSEQAIDSLSAAIQTGNTEADYGQFKLIIMIEDQKSAPHPEETPKKWTLKAYDIYVTDENVPLIVFNTAEKSLTNPDGPGGSPEENTFPKLTEGGDGKGPKYFLINGFTYDENSQGTGGVDIFRMAWIPYNMPGGPDGYVSKVRSALAAEGSLSAGSYPYPDGVQHWDLTDQVLADTTEDEKIGNPAVAYRKQIFQKQFNVLGDETHPNGWKDFHYEFDKGDGKGSIYQLENEAKLFVFYTKDRQNHGVFRTLRLLGNKKPPALTVRDATSESIDLIGIPLRENYSDQAAYNNALQAYQESAYANIKAQGSEASPAGA
ncbi:MAG: hypothetical protein LBF78_11985, partial [Treponema sp.]|nr:hypothetical protein [Treponema sp.]